MQWESELRADRARLLRDLEAGRASIHTVMLVPPDYMRAEKVLDVLLVVPEFGRETVQGILERTGIGPEETLGGISEAQRGRLVALLRGR